MQRIFITYIVIKNSSFCVQTVGQNSFDSRIFGTIDLCITEKRQPGTFLFVTPTHNVAY